MMDIVFVSLLLDVENRNVHQVDFAAFMKGDVDYVDQEEIMMVFETSPRKRSVVS